MCFKCCLVMAGLLLQGLTGQGHLFRCLFKLKCMLIRACMLKRTLTQCPHHSRYGRKEMVSSPREVAKDVHIRLENDTPLKLKQRNTY